MLIDTAAAPSGTTWRYLNTDDDRDLRIDFIRGIVMLILIVIHVELFSVYNFVVWERIGVVSGGEGFVILSGYITGLVSRKRMETLGWTATAGKLFSRAMQLWRVNVAGICFVAVLSLLPNVNLTSITTFTDRGLPKTYSLFPPEGASGISWILNILLLRIGPHQLQILGLYVCLMSVAPFLLKGLATRRTHIVLGLSWLVYGLNAAFPSMPTGAQFEYAFPLLTWQLIFVHGLAIGYHRARIWSFMESKRGRYIFAMASVGFVAFLFWAQNTPNKLIPSYARISVIPAHVYQPVYDRFMQKNTLGILRLLNYACVLLVGYAALTRYWKPIHLAFGWFFIPLGQASLYVFVMHVFVVAAIDNVLPFGFSTEHADLWVNTIAHTVALAALWLLVRYRVLFRWIPR